MSFFIFQGHQRTISDRIYANAGMLILHHFDISRWLFWDVWSNDNIPIEFVIRDLWIRKFQKYQNKPVIANQGTIRRGSRCSTSKAFLRPIRRRRNLHIAMHAQVTRILIAPNGGYEGSKPRAYGVRFKRDGKMYHVRARKEVRLLLLNKCTKFDNSNSIVHCNT